MTAAQRQRLIDVSSGRAEADIVLRNGRVVNVYTREVVVRDVAIADGRIASVSAVGGAAAQELDLDGAVVVPGLIEPHGHADILYTPAALVAHLALQGTTTISLEANELIRLLSDEDVVAMVTAMQEASVKCLWRISPYPYPGVPVRGGMRAPRLLEIVPDLVAIGEMVDWPGLLAGARESSALVHDALQQRLRVDAHLPGASESTLIQGAAAGLVSDHEAVTAAQIHDRLTLGYWAMLRSSSLRRDAGELAMALVNDGAPLERVMLTTDGPAAEDLLDGSLDGVVREVIAAGVDPVDAIRMATLAPATYLGLDGHVGGIAPGRCADLVVVDAMEEFRPRIVFSDGDQIDGANVSGGQFDWGLLADVPFEAAPLTEKLLTEVCLAGPALTLVNVITRLTTRQAEDGLVALIARDGTWMTGATIRGLEIRALASTHNPGQNVLLIGTQANLLVDVYRRVVALGGGLVALGAEVALPIGGYMCEDSVPVLAERIRAVTATLPDDAELPPLEFLTMFMATPALPEIRLTPSGIVDVKRGVITNPAVKIV